MSCGGLQGAEEGELVELPDARESSYVRVACSTGVVFPRFLGK